MDKERWQHIKRVFEDVVGRPADERSAMLERVCEGDAELRREVLSLLAAHEDDTPFLEEPVSDDALFLLKKEAGDLASDTLIGPYRLLHELGHGGMGTVYLAERADGQYQRQVALKLVRSGSSGKDLHQRFLHERQILASLTHPHIARLLGGGITTPTPGQPEGLPYLVMEYVKGVPIDQYCDDHHLSIYERLDLFRTVCEAVHFAHQNLVVHRDLKPSNIFVKTRQPSTATVEGTATGIVKLLDFGIAKLLDEEEASGQMTRTGVGPMTPEYASPEQIRGEPITTASDVYSLGVILYELLTGQRPYEVRGLSPSAIEKVVCEKEPTRPSTVVLRTVEREKADGEKHPMTPDVISRAPGTQPERLHRRLRGDLDNIILKALHKDPARRYESVAQFSEDLRRHRVALPVVARPDTMGYRYAKFVQRHRVGVTATALIVLALLGGIFATAYQARRAEHRFEQVRTLSNTLLFELHDAIRDLPGATSARQKLVSNALTYLDILNREAGDDPSLQLALAEAYNQVGEIQGNPHYTNLGDLGGAMVSYQKGFTLHETLWRQDTTNATVQQALANNYGQLAVVISWGGDNDHAITLTELALKLLQPLMEQNPDDDDLRHDAGRIRSELGWWLIWAGRIDDGLDHLDAAIAQLEPQARLYPGDLDLNLHLARAYTYQVDGFRFSGRHNLTLKLLQEKGLPHLQALEQRYPTHMRVQYGLHVCHDFIGGALEALGDLESAVSARQASLRYAQAMVAADSTNEKAYEGLARAHLAIGSLHELMGRFSEAITTYQNALTMRQAIYTKNPHNSSAGNGVGNGHRLLCRLFLRTNQLEEALAQCRQAAVVHEKVMTVMKENAVVKGNLASDYAFMARTYRAMARRATASAVQQQHQHKAKDWYDRALTILHAIQATGTEFEWEVHPDSLALEREEIAEALTR